MSTANIENKLLMIIRKERLDYQAIFDLIHEEKIELNEKVIDSMHIALLDRFTKESENLVEEARIDHLIECAESFKTVMDDLIAEYSPEFEIKKLQELKKNVVGSLKKKIKLLDSYETKKLTHPIKINCDNVVLAALFEEVLKEISTERKLERKIAHIISSNFLSKKESSINLETIYKEMTEGGGITQKAKDNLLEILERIIKRLK